MKRPLLLLFLSIHLSTSWALKLPFGLILSALIPKKNYVRVEPWEKAVDPNPGPTLEELEHTPIEQIDAVLDHVIGNHGGIVIHRYKPERWWLWKQWYSTVLYHSLSNALINMCGTLVFCYLARFICHGDWNIELLPDRSHPFIARLVLFDKIWKNMMGLVTFLLTFFVGQAYGLWRNFYDVARGIQGRMQDINLLLATHATRNENGEYTPESRAYLQDVASKLRAFHLLMWANNTKRFRVLLSSRGMSRLVARGVITEEENDTLDRLNISKTQKHCSYLEWVVTKTVQARKAGHIEYGAGFEQLFLEKITLLRGAYGTISDMVDGRMPLAYAHFVQILVDSFLFCAPLAQYADLGVFSVLSVGVLTVFFSGLLDLAKVFLDPLDNEDYREGCVYMDLAVLIREANGASTRWMESAAVLK